jgi:hypothetical protein
VRVRPTLVILGATEDAGLGVAESGRSNGFLHERARRGRPRRSLGASAARLGNGVYEQIPTKCGTHSGSKPGGGDGRRRGWRDTLTLRGRRREDKHGGHALPQHEEDRLDWEVRSFVYYHLVEHGLPRDRWRHPYVLVAANLTSISYPNLYPNPPRHHPTQTDTPRLGFLRKPASLGHPPISSDTRIPISRLRAESGLRNGPTADIGSAARRRARTMGGSSGGGSSPDQSATR